MRTFHGLHLFMYYINLYSNAHKVKMHIVSGVCARCSLVYIFFLYMSNAMWRWLGQDIFFCIVLNRRGILHIKWKIYIHIPSRNCAWISFQAKYISGNLILYVMIEDMENKIFYDCNSLTCRWTIFNVFYCWRMDMNVA